MIKLFFSKYKTIEFSNIKNILFSYLFKYVVGLIINIWIVRRLGDENFGIFSYVNSLSGIFGIISTFGLQTVIITSIINSDLENTKQTISNAFVISCITGIIAAVLQILFVIYYNFSEKIVIYLCLINILIYFFDTFKILTYYYESKVESSKVAKINNISLIICTFFRLVLLYNNLNIYFIAFSYVLDYIVVAFLLYFGFPRNIFNLSRIEYNKEKFTNIIKNSLPYLLSGLLINFFMKIDLVMIKNILNNKEAGIFAASVRLTEIWYFIPGVFQSTFFPNLFNNKENNSYKIKIIKLYKLMIIFSLFIIIITLIFGKFLIIKLFGIEYQEAYKPLQIHIWSLLFVSISVIRNSSLYAHNNTKIFFQITLIGAVSNYFLCYLFINYFGINGASLATVTSYFIVAYLTNYIYKSLHPEASNINTAFLNLFSKF